MLLESTQSEILQSFIGFVPYISTLFDEDVSFGIVDKEKYIYIKNGKQLKLNIKEGDCIQDGGAAKQAIKTEKALIKDVSKEVYGVPFKSYAIPIKDKKENVIGVFLVGKSLEKKERVLSLALELSSSMNQIETIMGKIILETEKIIDSNEKVLNSTNEANESVKNTDGVVKFVENISKQTNLLGINAAIEASRAGEAGKGFNVVAQEIRKLSNSSSQSIKKIDEVFKKVTDSIININENINESNHITKDQTENLSEIKPIIEKLSTVAKVLQKMAEEL